MSAYYLEIDPYCAQWLCNLIEAGHIAPGFVDCRDIRTVQPDDLRGFTQVHLFAGIGVWSHALRRAGWDDSRPVWTGSCPCQPFSNAGKRKGVNDDRHLWPEMFRFICQCRAGTVFIEQVSSPDGLAWLDIVQSELENEGYAFAALDTCAAGLGAPHIRSRLYGLAYRDKPGRITRELTAAPLGYGNPIEPNGGAGGLANMRGERDCGRRVPRSRESDNPGAGEPCQRFEGFCAIDRMAHDRRAGPVNGHWGAADWLRCRDGKWRPVEPGTQPLATGIAARVAKLRAIGNALCAPQAQAFIESAMECLP